MRAVNELPCAAPPDSPRLTSVVVPATRSRTYTSFWPFVSPTTRFVAKLEKHTKRPSAESEGPFEPPFASPPPSARLARSTMPVESSTTKMSSQPLPSPGTRSVAEEA